MANEILRELRELESTDVLGPRPAVAHGRDVRARKPALWHLLTRLDTIGAVARVLTLLTLDLAGVFLAIWTGLEVKAAVRGASNLGVSFREALDVAPLACLVTVLLFARSNLYGQRHLRPGFSRIVSSLFQVMVLLALYATVEGMEFSSYYIFYGSLFFALAYISAFRWAVDRVTARLLVAAGHRRRAVLVGSGPRIEAVAQALDGRRPGVEAVGFVSLTPGSQDGLRNFGPLRDLERHFGEFEEVLITDPDFPQDRAVELIDCCHRHGIRVGVAPSTMEILMDRVEFVPGHSLPLFEIKPPVFHGIDFVVKRAFDIVVSSLLLLVLAPVLVLIALAVRLTSRGPVLYRSMRPGIGGASFPCLKFRTMHQDAERRQAELEARNEMSGALFKMRHDPRLTRIGPFLRRYSLDELPQLLNVVRGQMSLVGPRPLPWRDYNRLEDWHRKRYLVLPGVTGLWQVSGRSELDFDELVRLDFLYLERWSVFLDLSIMLKTIPAVLRRRGAW